MECVGVMEPSECCNCIFQLTSITRTPLVSCPLEGELVEQSEAHVVIFLRLWLRLLGSGSRGRSSLASWSSSSSGSRGTSGRNGAELLCPLLDQLRDVLAGQLGDHFVHLLVIGVDTNGAENNSCNKMSGS